EYFAALTIYVMKKELINRGIQLINSDFCAAAQKRIRIPPKYGIKLPSMIKMQTPYTIPIKARDTCKFPVSSRTATKQNRKRADNTNTPRQETTYSTIFLYLTSSRSKTPLLT